MADLDRLIFARQARRGDVLVIDDEEMLVEQSDQSKSALIRGRQKTAFAIVIKFSNGLELLIHPEHQLLLRRQGTPTAVM